MDLMSGRDLADEVEIPPEATEPKAAFWTEPDAIEAAADAREFIRSGGAPYLWRWHTHTRPPRGATPPVYVGEFEMPGASKAKGNLSPCPVCSPNHRKFGKGRIAWFPDEGVLRLIGEDCFATLDPEGHLLADAEYRRKLERDNEIAYLTRHSENFDQSFRIIEDADEMAADLKVLHGDFHRALAENEIDIWNRIKSGDLMVEIEHDEFVFNSDGSQTTKKSASRIRHAKIEGAVFFRRSFPDIQVMTKKALQHFKAIRKHMANSNFSEWSDEERAHIHDQLQQGMRLGEEAIKLLREQRDGFQVTTLNTITAWSKRKEANMPQLHLRRVGRLIEIGRIAAKTTVNVPPSLFDPVPDFPLR